LVVGIEAFADDRKQEWWKKTQVPVIRAIELPTTSSAPTARRFLQEISIVRRTVWVLGDPPKC